MATAIALGNFDGVHKAHEALVRSMLNKAKREGLQSVVYIFEPHPRQMLSPQAPPALLMTTRMKKRRLLEIGADAVQLEERGMEILSLSPTEFVEKVLVGELDAKFVTAGFNYRFGKKAAGDAALLKTLCEEKGIVCQIMDRMEAGDAPISSTRLRALLEKGSIKEVNALSFAPYTLCGTVQTGKKLGREIGFPTLNIEIPQELLLPRKGVYISRTRINGKEYGSVTNIGRNPTVEQAVPRAESYLFNFSAEAYGQEAEITLLDFLRPEQQFGNLEALQAQIRQDTEKAKQYLIKHE